MHVNEYMYACFVDFSLSISLNSFYMSILILYTHFKSFSSWKMGQTSNENENVLPSKLCLKPATGRSNSWFGGVKAIGYFKKKGQELQYVLSLLHQHRKCLWGFNSLSRGRSLRFTRSKAGSPSVMCVKNITA